MTEISISGEEFLIDGTPAYAGRVFAGKRIQGLLFNVRAVQATFDDGNPDTRRHWAYPDTGEWDPDRNVADFCAALPSWRDHGVLGFTLNFQGGGALYAPEIYSRFDNNGFTPAGDLKPACAERMATVLDRADELGMVPIVGLFYGVHLKKMRDEAAVWRAGHAALEFLVSTGHRNLLIEVANEIEVCAHHSGYDIYDPMRAHEMVSAYKEAHPGLIFSTSQGGVKPETNECLPTPRLYEATDFVLIHGNGARAARLEAAIQAIRAMQAFRANPKPIVINEDSPGIPNLEAAWRNGASWGYFDQGFGGEAAWNGDAYVDYRSRPRESRFEDLSGFQTPPTNWTINTDLKRAFFERVAEITGASVNDSRVLDGQ
ncbi:MAG: hypothetical protein GX620_00745 [Chloroflexi bacterium]|nr:hypothetical protein [Chloroflexota bacterium]